MQEIQYSGGEVRTVVMGNEPEAERLFEVVKENFPWASLSDYESVSTPTRHSVLNELVVTCVLTLPQTNFLIGREHAIGARKFCLSSKTSYLRGYKIFEGDNPPWAPKTAKMLCHGINMRELGHPAPDMMDSFVDYYFSGDPDDVEAHFGLDRLRGAYETFYGATVINGKTIRVKQYVYDEQTMYSDWDVLYLVRKKRLDEERAAEAQGLNPGM